MDKSAASRPTFFWQGVLILLPVIVLAAVGFVSLRQDRILARTQAQERCKEAGEVLAGELSRELPARLLEVCLEAEKRSALENSQLEAHPIARPHPGPLPRGEGVRPQAMGGVRSDWNFDSKTGVSLPAPQMDRLVSDWRSLPALALTPFVLGALGDLLSVGDGSSNRAVVPVNPPFLPLPSTKLSAEQARLWGEARQAEFVTTVASDASRITSPLSGASPRAKGERLEPTDVRLLRSLDAIRLYGDFLKLSPPTEFVAPARYALAVLLAKNQKTMAARKLFSELGKETGAFTEAGLPIGLLAQFQDASLLWETSIKIFTKNPTPRLIGTDSEKLIAARIEALCSNAVERPCLITPTLLQAAAELEKKAALEGSISARWLRVWQREEAIRRFCATRDFAGLRAGVSWVEFEDSRWLMLAAAQPDGFRVELFPEAALSQAVLDILTRSKTSLPRFAQARLTLEGRPEIGTNSNAPILADLSGSLKFHEASIPGAAFAIVLSDSAALYSAQRQRTLLFGALVLCSALAAMIGFFSAYRGFRQQIHLNEMKSNFVSSVSHELRAPIASVRLLAEALDRGKIQEPAKQKEYFGFIVQECRRLSTLIGNVLDFSRIEQGRKKYQFEPIDLAHLLEQTVKLMAPAAAERQVALELRLDLPTESPALQPVWDGFAIQQALINLIDNALKHSPAGTHVKVECEANYELRITNYEFPAAIQLSVEDQGPGIPPEDHERIFERFYRRGSELRRETQGVGIGLAIVKHIVAAHGGRVQVRSAVGEGSRFTIELPVSRKSLCRES